VAAVLARREGSAEQVERRVLTASPPSAARVAISIRTMSAVLAELAELEVLPSVQPARLGSGL
jgi:hypothetical protein